MTSKQWHEMKDELRLRRLYRSIIRMERELERMKSVFMTFPPRVTRDFRRKSLPRRSDH